MGKSCSAGRCSLPHSSLSFKEIAGGSPKNMCAVARASPLQSQAIFCSLSKGLQKTMQKWLCGADHLQEPQLTASEVHRSLWQWVCLELLFLSHKQQNTSQILFHGSVHGHSSRPASSCIPRVSLSDRNKFAYHKRWVRSWPRGHLGKGRVSNF